MKATYKDVKSDILSKITKGEWAPGSLVPNEVDLAEWLEGQRMDHVRGAPLHPQTQGKIERWHQTMKNRRSEERRVLKDCRSRWSPYK